MEQKEANLMELTQMVIDKKTSVIAKFDRRNTNELLTIILDDISKYTSLELEAAEARNIIEGNEERKEQLLYQKGLTKDDIINENLIKIYVVYNIILAAVWLTSADMLIFIKDFLICSGIGASSFWVNLNYFSSNFRKEQIVSRVDQIDIENVDCKRQIEILEKLEKTYLDLLRFEVDKLYDMTKNKKYSYEGINKLLTDLKMDFLIHDFKPKKRIRKK